MRMSPDLQGNREGMGHDSLLCLRNSVPYSMPCIQKDRALQGTSLLAVHLWWLRNNMLCS